MRNKLRPFVVTIGSFLLVPNACLPKVIFVSSFSILRGRNHHLRSLCSSATKGGDNNNSWEYVPYVKPTDRPKKTIGTSWKVPKEISIPEDQLEFSFVRSSGAGGQNVNKLSTKVEVRFNILQKQSWMPWEVQERLKEQQSKRVSKEGIFSITSQEHRTQGRNRSEALSKLKAMVLQAWPRPKIRKQRTGISKAAKERNKEFKKRRSQTKANRKRVDF